MNSECQGGLLWFQFQYCFFYSQPARQNNVQSCVLMRLFSLSGAAHQLTITSMLPESASKSFTDKIKYGEIKLACFLAEHNLPFSRRSEDPIRLPQIQRLHPN